jgi:hypothetical protein
MVSKFGSVVEVKRHCGWTGNPETSWKTMITVSQSKYQTKKSPKIKFLFNLDTDFSTKTLAEIDGDDSILYRIDLTTEMAFYLPQQFSSKWLFFSSF